MKYMLLLFLILSILPVVYTANTYMSFDNSINLIYVSHTQSNIPPAYTPADSCLTLDVINIF